MLQLLSRKTLVTLTVIANLVYIIWRIFFYRPAGGGRGCIQTGRRVNFLFLKGLTFAQKLSYLSSITYWYASIKRFFYIMSPIMFSVFGVIVVQCTLPQVLAFWLPMYLLIFLHLTNLDPPFFV